MPIEIKELHIKAVVSSGAAQQQGTSILPGDMLKMKKEMIKEVTEKVLKILQQKNER